MVHQCFLLELTHIVCPETFHLSDDVWQCLQQSYSFRFVFKLPQGFPGINILNLPVKSVKETENTDTLGSVRNNAASVSATSVTIRAGYVQKFITDYSQLSNWKNHYYNLDSKPYWYQR